MKFVSLTHTFAAIPFLFVMFIEFLCPPFGLITKVTKILTLILITFARNQTIKLINPEAIKHF